MTSQTVAVFPPRILKDRNPYARLLYRELEQHGFDTIDGNPFRFRWLLDSRERIDILHFHWDPQQRYVRRDPDTITKLLTSLRLDRLVPWWDVAGFSINLLVARLLGYRIVWTVHEVRPHESDHVRQDVLASQSLARLSHVLIAHDAATADRAAETLRVSREKVSVVAHASYVGVYGRGRSRDLVRAELGISSEAFVFLTFGHMRGYKDLPVLFEGFRSMDNPAAQLIVAGVPWDSDIRKVVTDAAERDGRIKLMPDAVADDAVAELFGAADVAVCPRSDGWTSGSLILAMSMGIPVIAANRPAYVDLMDGDNAGWTFDGGSAEGLRDCMSIAAADPVLAREKGANALALMQRMTWTDAAAATARLIAPRHVASAAHSVNPAPSVQST